MKTTSLPKNKPSIAARFLKWQLERRGIKSYISDSMGVIALLSFLMSLCFLAVGVRFEKMSQMIFASCWMSISTFWFMLSGCFELIDREYIKKDSNQIK